jgi:hypothetical protein
VRHHRSPPVSLLRAAVRAAVPRAEMPGFFALAAEIPTPRVARGPRLRSRRPRTPCAHRLGERTRSRALGRVMSSGCLTREPPGLPCLSHQTRGLCLRAGLAPAHVSLHAPSTGSMSSIMGQTVLPDTITEGHARASRPSHTQAPLLLRRTNDDLVQVSGLLRRSTSSPRWASRLASNPSPRCLEHRFYNRRFASRAPAETPSSETLRRTAVGKPAGVRLRGSRSGQRRCRPTENDAGPPRGHPASNGLALDGALPASGRSTFPRGWHGEGESLAAFSAGESSVDSNPLTPLAAPGHGMPEHPCFRTRGLVPTGARQCARLSGARRCLPPEKTARASLESSRDSAAFAGRRRQPPHVFIDVRERSTRPLHRALSRASSRPRALLWLLQSNVSASTTVGRSNTPTAEARWGRLPGWTGSPRSTAITEQAGGQGPRRTVPRALPATIARRGDFAPTSTVSSASCRGRRSLALSGVTWGARGAAIASRACRARERQDRATPSFREET